MRRGRKFLRSTFVERKVGGLRFTDQRKKSNAFTIHLLKFPWDEEKTNFAIMIRLNDGKRLECPSHWNPELSALVRGAFAVNPEDRPELTDFCDFFEKNSKYSFFRRP